MRGLLALLPGRISTPLSPPFRAEARLSRRKPLFGLTGPWQRIHEVSKIGLISREKSTCFSAEGGSLDTSTGSAARTLIEEAKATPKNHNISFPNRPLRMAGCFFNRRRKVACLNHGRRRDNLQSNKCRSE